MKRALILPFVISLLAILSIILLTACSGESSLEETPTAASTGLPSPSPTSTPLPGGATTSARIRARGTLRVGVRYDLMPFGYVTDEGEVAGFGVDVGRELARRWLGDPDAVQFEQVRSDTAIDHLQAGDVDLVVTALIHSQDREALADFSLPFFVDGHALLVRSGDASALGSLESLQGRPVGVLAWEDAADALRGVVPFTLTFQVYDRFDGAVAALERGEVDAVTELRRRLFWGQHLFPEAAIVNQYTTASVGFVFAQNDPHFADLVNLTFQELLADGTYAALYSRWFPEYPPTVERWPGTEVPTLADAPVVASVPDTISAIQSRGRLVVAMPTDRSPFAYVDGTGTPVGYEVNLVQRIAGRWLGDSTAVEFVTTTLPLGREMVQTGEADMVLGGLRHTRELELELDTSLTTYWAGEGLLVWAGTPVTDLLDLSGQPVAVVESSLGVLQQAMQDAGAQLTVMPQPTVESAIRLLEGGYAVAVVGDRADLLGPAYATPGMGVLPLRLVHVPVTLGLPPGDSAFRDLVNLTLQAMKAEGELDALYWTWFDDAPPAFESWPGIPYRPLRLETDQASEG